MHCIIAIHQQLTKLLWKEKMQSILFDEHAAQLTTDQVLKLESDVSVSTFQLVNYPSPKLHLQSTPKKATKKQCKQDK